MNKLKLWFVMIFLGLSMVLGACAPMRAAQDAVMEAPAMEPAYDSYEMAVEQEFAAEEERGLTSGVGETAKEIERMVIYNADMRICSGRP
jgi:hypothetical protein